jgi:hypothetical protein
MIDMAWRLLRVFFPGVYLGFDMMPTSWLFVIAIGFLFAIVPLSQWREGQKRRRKWLMVTVMSFTMAVVFYVCAVWYAHNACNSYLPGDAFCIFDGFPYLSVSALALAIGLLAAIQSIRLSKSVTNRRL